MLLKRSSLLAIVISTLSGCSAAQVKLESSPDGATVRVTQSSRTVSKVGVTPMVLDSSQSPDLFKKPIQISFEKDGYETQTVFIPQTSLAASGDINVSLKKNQVSSIDSTVNAVAQAQRLIFKKDLAGAETILAAQINQSPSLAVLHSLQGNVFYLQKRLNDALQSYERAAQLEPGNPEVARMVSKLKSFHTVKDGI